MTTLDTNRTMADLALSHSCLISAFEEIGLDYCCGGQRTLLDAITTHDLNVDDVLARLQEALDKSAPRDLPDFVNISLTDLVNYIKDTHHTFLWTRLPETAERMEKVARVHGSKHPEMLGPLHSLFNNLRAELENHLQKEELILFPGIIEMDTTPEGAMGHCGGVQNPIRMMMMEHDDAGDVLRKIRTLTNDFTPPEGACTTFKRLFLDLKEIEADLHQHIHLENNVLFPRAVETQATPA